MRPGIEHVLKRWGFPTDGDNTVEGQLMAISLGLDALFGSNADAEKFWMLRYNPRLGEQPLIAICHGRIEAVIDELDFERNLR